MEAIQGLIAELVVKMPIVGFILMGLGGLVVLAQIVVAITPSKDDDAFVAKVKSIPILGQVIALIEAFAPLQKKADGGMSLSVAKKD